MRVIEKFVTSVPREEIPADAKWFMQDAHTKNLKFSRFDEKPTISISHNQWFRGPILGGDDNFGSYSLSTDAAETVVTREELMLAYDLVEQGYTLWFGGKCPVAKDVLVDVITLNNFQSVEVSDHLSWHVGANIIAYRLSRSVDKDVAADLCPAAGVSVSNKSTPQVKTYEISLPQPVTDVLKTRLELLDKLSNGVWPGSDDEKFLVSEHYQSIFLFEPEKLITRAQWDDYVSRKIRVGDKVKTTRGTEVEVLFVGEEKAFIKFENGTEMSISLDRLTRISQ